MKTVKAFALRHFETTLIILILFGVIAIAFLVHYKFAFLNFFFLPVILAGYYLGKRQAVLTASLCVLSVILYLIFAYVLPGGYQFCGEYYDVSTTATVVGPITICMTYEDEDVPGGNEEALCLLHYNEAIPGYEDITISRDPVNNIVCGQVDSLSVFGLASMPVFGGFRQPINADGSSVFKAGRTIPVKFALYDALGNPISNATCHLATWQVSSEIVGSVPETAEAAYADAGDTFRYDPEGEQYIYNLSTKGMDTGTWMLRVTADGWPGFEATVMIGLR